MRSLKIVKSVRLEAKNFLIQSGKVNRLDFLNFEFTDGGPWNYNNLTVSVLVRVSFLFAWLRLCQDQATCAQPQVFGPTNKHTISKQS